MTRTYRTISGIYGYKTGIYDDCQAVIESNGRHIRTKVDGVKWHGNTGGFHTQVTYYDLPAGRKLLREFREARIEWDIKCTYRGPSPHDVLSGY